MQGQCWKHGRECSKSKTIGDILVIMIIVIIKLVKGFLRNKKQKMKRSLERGGVVGMGGSEKERTDLFQMRGRKT